MAKRTIAEPKRALNKADIRRYAQEYIAARRMAADAAKREAEMKATLAKAVEELGYTDDKGNQFLDIGIEGCDKLKRERRVSQRFDTEKAAAWLKKRKRYADFTETIVQLSEDKILAAAFEGDDPDVTEKVVKGFYVDSETMAFKVLT